MVMRFTIVLAMVVTVAFSKLTNQNLGGRSILESQLDNARSATCDFLDAIRENSHCSPGKTDEKSNQIGKAVSEDRTVVSGVVPEIKEKLAESKAGVAMLNQKNTALNKALSISHEKIRKLMKADKVSSSDKQSSPTADQDELKNKSEAGKEDQEVNTVQFPWPSQTALLMPVSKSRVTRLAGMPSQSSSVFKAGQRSGVSFGRRSNRFCMPGHPLLMEEIPGAGGFNSLSLTAGRATVLVEQYSGVTYLYTVQAGRILQVNMQTGIVVALFDMCQKGYFSRTQWGWTHDGPYQQSTTCGTDHTPVGSRSVVPETGIPCLKAAPFSSPRRRAPTPKRSRLQEVTPPPKVMGGAAAGVAFTEKHEDTAAGGNRNATAEEMQGANGSNTRKYEVGDSGSYKTIAMDDRQADNGRRRVLMFIIMQLRYFKVSFGYGYHDKYRVTRPWKHLQSLVMVDALKGSAVEFEPKGIPMSTKEEVFTMAAVTLKRRDVIKRSVKLFVASVQGVSEFGSCDRFGTCHSLSGFRSTTIYSAELGQAKCPTRKKCVVEFSELLRVDRGILSLAVRIQDAQLQMYAAELEIYGNLHAPGSPVKPQGHVFQSLSMITAIQGRSLGWTNASLTRLVGRTLCRNGIEGKHQSRLGEGDASSSKPEVSSVNQSAPHPRLVDSDKQCAIFSPGGDDRQHPGDKHRWSMWAQMPTTSVDGQGSSSQCSSKGICTGPSVRFVRTLQDNGYIDGQMSGVSLTISQDPETKRSYVFFSEGASSSIRAMDITNSTAEGIKIKSFVTAFGVREIAHVGPNRIAIFDGNGVLSVLDTRPALPCGNAFNYSREAFSRWKPGHLVSGTPITLESNHTVKLRRASESSSSPGHPWQLVVQRKLLRPYEDSHIFLAKAVFCSRPLGVHSFECCVEKGVFRPNGHATGKAAHSGNTTCTNQACRLGISEGQFKTLNAQMISL